MALEQFLKKKGPFGLPMPVVIIAGAGAAYYLYSRNQTTTADPATSDTTDGGQGADASGNGSTPDSSFGPGGSTTYVTKNVTINKRAPRRRPRRRPRFRGGRARKIRTSASRSVAASR
jgi:hypothetical protein